jgi:hypothetical protein
VVNPFSEHRKNFIETNQKDRADRIAVNGINHPGNGVMTAGTFRRFHEKRLNILTKAPCSTYLFNNADHHFERPCSPIQGNSQAPVGWPDSSLDIAWFACGLDSTGVYAGSS